VATREVAAALFVMSALVAGLTFVGVASFAAVGGGGGCAVGVALNNVTYYDQLSISGGFCYPSGGAPAGTPVYVWVVNSEGVTVASQTFSTTSGGSFGGSLSLTGTGSFTAYVSACPQSAASCAYAPAAAIFSLQGYPVGTTTTVTQVASQTECQGYSTACTSATSTAGGAPAKFPLGYIVAVALALSGTFVLLYGEKEKEEH
jgi:hypothetical protein